MVKKISALFLALVLCLSVMVVPVSAAPTLTDSQGSGIGFGFYTEDGTTAITSVKAGDKVTVKIYATSATDNDVIQNLGFQVWYNNAVYKYLPETFAWGPEFVTYLDTTLSKAEKITSATGAAYTNVFGAMTAEEQAYGWNEAVQGVPAIAKKTWTAKENADKPIAVFQLQVLDGVENGTVAALGAPAKSTFVKRNAFYNYVNTTAVAKPTNATTAAKLALDNGNGLSLKVKIPACETHTWDNGVAKPAATCGAAGEMLYTCTVCFETKTEAIEATGNHTAGEAVEENVVPASCNTAGSKDVVTYCTVCEAEVSRQENVEIPATGNHNYATKVVKAEPTCTATGSYVMACGCGAEDEAVTIDALGHDFSEVDAEAVDATCTADGSEVLMGCSRCDATEGGAVIPATGHDMQAGTVVEATCTTDGYTVYTCANGCGETDNRDVVTATGHDHEAVVTPPTCTEAGYTTYTCACGDTYTSDEVAATGHSYEATFTKNPTCTKDGYTRYTCACGDTYEEAIAKRDHKNADGSSATVVVPGKEATCVATGLTDGEKCTLCNSMTVPQTTIPKTGHSKDNAVVTEPTYSSQGYTTYTCGICGTEYKDDYVPALSVDFTFEIAEPSVKTLRARDTLVLHTVFTGEVSDDVTVVWTADNNMFKTNELDDGSLEINARKNGTTVFTATVYDAEGNEIASDTVEIVSNAKFFQQFLGFFRAIFGTAKYYEN